jgi:hypothetical protein
MGAGNVAVVLTVWSPRLNDRPFRVLVQMALTSLDDQAPPRYWGGWAALATAAGALVPEGCHTCPECPACQAAQRVVRRAVAQLVAAGALRRTDRPRRGRNAEYELLIHTTPDAHLPPSRYGPGPGRHRTPGVRQPTTPAPVENPTGTEEDETDHRTPGVRPPPDARCPVSTGRSASAPPDARRPAAIQEKKEKEQEQGPGTTSPQATDPPAAVDEYQAAVTILAARPDLGVTYTSQVPGHLSLREQVIAAARLATAEHPRPPTTPRSTT